MTINDEGTKILKKMMIFGTEPIINQQDYKKRHRQQFAIRLNHNQVDDFARNVDFFFNLFINQPLIHCLKAFGLA